MIQLVFETVLRMSMQGVIIFAVLFLMRFILKKLHISHKYITVLWVILFFYLVFPWKLELSIGFWNEESISSWSFESEAAELFGEDRTWNAESGAVEDAGTENSWNLQNVDDTDLDGGMSPTYLLEKENVQLSISVRETLALLIPYIWGVGACLLFGHFIYSYLAIRRRLMLCKKDRDNIRLAQDVQTPMVFGFIKPYIYLPVNMQTEGIEYVLAHEKMHIKRGDNILKILAYFICILHWFNPLVWISYRLLGDDMEKACDEAVVRSLGEDKRKEYANALLRVAEGKATGGKRIFVAPICFDEGNVKSRIKNIIKYKYTLPVAGGIVLVIALVLGIVLLTKTGDEADNDSVFVVAEGVDAGLREDILLGLNEQNEEPDNIEDAVMIRENFQDVLGYDGYLITTGNGGPHMTTTYYAVEGDKAFIIATSWGFEREDYFYDLDGDGVRELICNVCWGDGVCDALIYRRFEDGIRVTSGRSLMDEEYDNVGANSLHSKFDITDKKVVVSYWKEDTQCYNNKSYELDLDSVSEWQRPDIPETGNYTLKSLDFYDGDIEITAAAIGKEIEEYDICGVKEIDIYINNSLSQTLVMQEAIERDGIPMVEEGYTRCPESIAEDHLINTVDINFDGYLDLQVFAWNTKDDDLYYYYCWNPNESKFEYAFCLNTPEIDTENQLLITYNIVSRYEMYHYKYYKVNEDNTLELIKTVEEPVEDTGY
ncbi:MAG: M56 family metallopeptidase [Lachnospiraceae bacterium]|nr:M56 family metallopeptidase [Lachnospiraceae bacterium]